MSKLSKNLVGHVSEEEAAASIAIAGMKGITVSEHIRDLVVADIEARRREFEVLQAVFVLPKD
ncbi:MAG: hypothetical protein PSX71_08740 [bacterium]|nr:hypothetical protein [bacterium]